VGAARDPEDLMPRTRHLLKRLLVHCLEEEIELYLRAVPQVKRAKEAHAWPEETHFFLALSCRR